MNQLAGSSHEVRCELTNRDKGPIYGMRAKCDPNIVQPAAAGLTLPWFLLRSILWSFYYKRFRKQAYIYIFSRWRSYVCELYIMYCLTLLHRPLWWNFWNFDFQFQQIWLFIKQNINLQKIFSTQQVGKGFCWYKIVTFFFFLETWRMILWITKWTLSGCSFFFFLRCL